MNPSPGSAVPPSHQEASVIQGVFTRAGHLSSHLRIYLQASAPASVLSWSLALEWQRVAFLPRAPQCTQRSLINDCFCFSWPQWISGREPWLD